MKDPSFRGAWNRSDGKQDGKPIAALAAQREIERLRSELAKREQLARRAEIRLQQIENSAQWRAYQKCCKVLDRLLPPTSIRRAVIRALFEPGGIEKEVGLVKEARLIARSGLFDKSWYLKQNPDVAEARVDPVMHYVLRGAAEGRDPNPLFDTEYYLHQHPEAATAGVTPLTHYLQTRSVQSRSEQEEWEPFANEIIPFKRLVQSSGLFDALWYQKQYPDVAAARMNPLEHFVEYGSREIRSPGPHFDARWYVQEYPEVFASGLSPLEHYLRIGRRRGYRPVGRLYETWCRRFDSISAADCALIRRDISLKSLPFLEVLVTVDPETEPSFERVLRSLEGQIFSEWRAHLILDPRCTAETRNRAQKAAGENPRYAVVSEEYTVGQSRGRPGLMVFVSGVILREHALYMLADAAASLQERGLIYCDEDHIDEQGTRKDPVFKPQFSPKLCEQTNYIGDCFLICDCEAEITKVTKGLASGLKPEAYLKSFMRQAKPNEVIRIPCILYHNPRQPLPGSERNQPLQCSEYQEVLPTFSVIIPTRDGSEYLRPCIESIEQSSDYPRDKIEIIVVDNGSSERNTLDYLRSLSKEGRAKIVRQPGRFNYSRLNNLGACYATGEVLLFLNNDTLVEDPSWLRKIAVNVMQDTVGAVGAKLLYPDRSVQHGGVILGIRGLAGHNLAGLPENDSRVREDLTREVSAVTGACLAIRRSVFEQIGGFDTVPEIAFSDVLLCLDLLKAGYRNIYIKDALLIHCESKSRGYDDTAEKILLNRKEACYARRRHPQFFEDDPYYNPNLCLDRAYELAFPPRQSKPWRKAATNPAKLRVLLLSCTHEMGHGVAVVLAQQARYLAGHGHEVFVGGPKGESEIAYKDCHRIYLNDPGQAACFAVEKGMDCVVAQTPPFFSVVKWLGKNPPVLCLDHGEPPAELFPDVDARKAVLAEKRLCFAMASKVAAISEAVRAEGTDNRATIIPNANSHLTPPMARRERREFLRHSYGWSNKAVILNVCRFTASERHYKGLGVYSELAEDFRFWHPELGRDTVFVLCGKGTPDDVREMEKRGLVVFANVSEKTLSDLYVAADIYANFSRWEGYNLGIGQALAYGLPVVASDIPAHRAFPIFTSNQPLRLLEKLSELVRSAMENRFSGEPRPVVWQWQHSVEILEREILQLVRNAVSESNTGHSQSLRECWAWRQECSLMQSPD